jgi:hypothetical protein
MDDRWQGLLGARIERVDGGVSGETRIAFATARGQRTVVVAHTRAVRSSLGETPSGAIERVTPVFTDDAASFSIETDRGEHLTVAGGRAWMT